MNKQLNTDGLSDEQSDILHKIHEDDCELLVVDSVAGSGKTTMLVAIAKSFAQSNGIYIAYSKAIATEAARKFPKSITCSTTHSMAYQNTVVPFKLKVGFFGYRDIQARIKFEEKILVVEHLKNYCLSKYISIDDYFLAIDIKRELKELVKKYLGLMKSGSIECTHDFYLKYYHILLSNGIITHNTFDIIMLDEAGDLNEVTLEIFKLLPAKKKVMVGDPYQNIFQFNKTINGFHAMKGIGDHMSMSKSFRVDSNIAKSIQFFCRNFLNEKMVFRGIDYSDEQKANIKTSAFISRTNSTLIGKMIELNKSKSEYGLTRPAKSIFELPLGIITLKSKGYIKVPQYKFLEQDYQDYIGSSRLQDNSSFYGYLGSLYADDIAIKSAISLIMNHGPQLIIQTFEAAKSHEKGSHNLTLMTGHSAKGLEADSVYIADDFHEKLKKIFNTRKFKSGKLDSLNEDDMAELNLYYVACSRAIFQLKNAKALSWTADTNFDDESGLDAMYDQEMQRYLTREENEYYLASRGE